MTDFGADSASSSNGLAELITDSRVVEPDFSLENVPISKLSGSQMFRLGIGIRDRAEARGDVAVPRPFEGGGGRVRGQWGCWIALFGGADGLGPA